MTSPDLTQTAQTAADRAPDGAVTAILVTHGTTRFLGASVAAVQACDPAPDRIVVVDVSADSSAAVATDDRTAVLRAPGAKTFGAAVTHAVREAGVDSVWLWLLHDDSAPEPGALGLLLRALEHTTQVAVAGPKQVRWDAPGELVEVGVTVSRSGRRMTGLEEHELDQGQHDSREDVLAVGLAGALVRRSVWQELRGTDPTYGPFGDGLDLCYRARRAGHRVLVVPEAVVRHAQASLTGERKHGDRPADARTDDVEPLVGGDPSFGARLRSQLYLLATTVPGWVLPFFLVAAVLSGPVRALYRVALKQPGQAVDELWSPLWLLARTGRVLVARARAARTATVPRRLLRPLLATTRDVFTAHQDRRLAARARRKQLTAPSALDRDEIVSVTRRRRAALAAVLALVAAVTVVALRPVLGTLVGDGRVVGGALLPARGGWSDLWQAVSSGWVRDGLGASAPADPLLTALLPVTALTGGDLQLAVNAVAVLGLVFSALGAWFAVGAATRSISLRLWAVLVWVAAPALLMAVGQGRLGAVLVHAALPWFALALARGIGVQRTDTWGRLRMRSQARADERFQTREQHRAAQAPAVVPSPDGSDIPLGRVRARSLAVQPSPRGSLAALGAAALVAVVVVAGAPVLLVPLLLVLVVVALAAPRHRRLLVLVPLPAVVVVGPLLVRAVATWSSGGWRILLGDPGLATASAGARGWQQVVGLPDLHSTWFTADGVWGAVGRYGPYALGAVLVLCALVGLVRRGGRGTVARAAWAVAAVGLATAQLSAATVVAAGVDGPVTGWSGAGLSLMTLGLLTAAVVGLDGLSDAAATYTFGWRQLSVGVLAVVVAAVPLVSLGVWTAQARGESSPVLVHALERPIVPAVGQQMQTSGRQARVLILETRPDGSVDYQLLHDDGPQLTDSSVVVDVATLGGRPDDLAGLVAELAAGVDGDQAEALAGYGVGGVLVPPSQDVGQARLVSRIDTVAGIQRITENESGTIWRVVPGGSLEPEDQPAWAHTTETDPETGASVVTPVPAGHLRVDTDVAPGAAGRVVSIAENAAPGWRGTLDGVPLRSVGTDVPAFELGAGGGHLVIEYERSSRTPWLVLQGTVLLVLVLLALPIRRRRGGAR